MLAFLSRLADMILCAMFVDHRPIRAGQDVRCALCGVKL
jgi:hypothetical protein